jgi:hypothetical protein
MLTKETANASSLIMLILVSAVSYHAFHDVPAAAVQHPNRWIYILTVAVKRATLATFSGARLCGFVF